MTNQVQARTIALFYCNASFEPEKNNTHATVDHDSLVPTLYGIVMVDFTLVTCSSHSICLVSTTFSNKSTILTLCLICLLPVCYIHLITCLSDQTLDSFLSPPIDRDETEVHAELSSCPLKIYMCHQPNTIGIIIEGQPVVRGVPNLSKAYCLLCSLFSALINVDFGLCSVPIITSWGIYSSVVCTIWEFLKIIVVQNIEIL